MTLTYGELFAGVGGFSIGFDQAGWTPKFQVEWDAHCQQTLRYHWPDVPKWGDVSEVSGFDLPPVDLIAFGSPCQDLSVAGKRAGLEGERSGLFHEAMRIINEMKEATGGQYPRWVVWENVAGAFSSGRGDDFETVLKEMGNLGCHHLEWHCLDAQFFGVPQRRRRVFVVACLDSRILGRGGTEIFPVGESRQRDTSKGKCIGFYRTHGKQDHWQQGVSPPLKTISPVCVVGEMVAPRTMTPVEHERLMGWPDNHTLHRADNKNNSDTTRYKMCGNGVASPVAAWLAHHINQAEQGINQ